MSNVDLSWMNVPGPDGLTWAQKNAPDLSWMNVPGADGRTFAQNAEGLGWMNIPGPDGLTFVQKYQQGKLPGQTPIAPPATGTTEDRNAFSILKKELETFGLGGMADKVWKYMLENGSEDDAGTMLWIYQQPEFKARFPAFETLQKKYRGIQPAQYIMLERQYAQTMRSAGLSASFFDNPNDFTALIENDVSQAEFQERVDNGFKKVAEADPAVRNAFRQYFGVEGDAALAAFFIDPDRSAPKLAKAAQMAELGGAASTMGVQINADYAEKLTRLGVSQQQALSGFQKMQQQRALFSAGLGENAVTPQTTGMSDTARALRGERSFSPAVMPPGWQEGDPIPGANNGPNIQDTSTMTTENQLGTDYAFGTDVNVQRELELRLAKRKAQASGTSQQVVADRQGRTAIGTAD
jgi:hypothetical protein